MATGIWTMKIDRQAKAAVSKPPATGPSAVPATPATAHCRAPASSSPADGDEELKAADEHERAPGRLERPGRDEHGE